MNSMWTAPCDPRDGSDPWDRDSPEDGDPCRMESECLRAHDGGGICATETECAERRERWAVEKAMEDGNAR